MTRAGPPLARPPRGQDGQREHAERQRGERQARLHRVVLEHHLQIDGQRDHHAAEGDLLEHLGGDPEPEALRGEQVRIDQRRGAGALAPHQPAGQEHERDHAERDQRAHELAALLPDQDAEHDAAHADDRERRADQVDVPVTRVGHVADQLDAGQHDGDHDGLERERDAPGQIGRDEPAEQRPDRGRDRGRRADQRVDPLLRRALEVAVDQRLHGGQQQRRADPAEDRPEDDDRRQVLRERHRHRADRVPEQPQHVGPLAADQVADLAGDEDERRGHERLERDRRLHAADRRVEIRHHRGDRDVHQRRVDDEHEHRHRQEDRQPRGARRVGHGPIVPSPGRALITPHG